jgi:hypothetical protein
VRAATNKRELLQIEGSDRLGIRFYKVRHPIQQRGARWTTDRHPTEAITTNTGLRSGAHECGRGAAVGNGEQSELTEDSMRIAHTSTPGPSLARGGCLGWRACPHAHTACCHREAAPLTRAVGRLFAQPGFSASAGFGKAI